MGAKTLRELGDVRSTFERELKEFGEFKTRIILERQQYESLVEDAVSQFVDLQFALATSGGTIHPTPPSTSGGTIHPTPPSTSGGTIHPTAPSASGGTIHPTPPSPLDVYRDGQRVRKSLLDLDSFGVLRAGEYERRRREKRVRDRIHDGWDRLFGRRGVSPTSWPKDRIGDVEARAKRSFNILTDVISNAAAPASTLQGDGEVQRKVASLADAVRDAIDFLDSRGRLLNRPDCRKGYHGLSKAMEDLKEKSRAGGTT